MKPIELDEGDLWSFLRTVIGQGVDIEVDAVRLGWSYEARSARLDAAAAERAQELLTRLNTHNDQAQRTAEGGPLEPPVLQRQTEG